MLIGSVQTDSKRVCYHFLKILLANLYIVFWYFLFMGGPLTSLCLDSWGGDTSKRFQECKYCSSAFPLLYKGTFPLGPAVCVNRHLCRQIPAILKAVVDVCVVLLDVWAGFFFILGLLHSWCCAVIGHWVHWNLLHYCSCRRRGTIMETLHSSVVTLYYFFVWMSQYPVETTPEGSLYTNHGLPFPFYASEYSP